MKLNADGEKLLAAIQRNIRRAPSAPWEHPLFEEARDLTEKFGCVWDFLGWGDAGCAIRLYGRLGGIDFREPALPKVVQIATTEQSGLEILTILTDSGEVWQLENDAGAYHDWVRVRLPWEPEVV